MRHRIPILPIALLILAAGTSRSDDAQRLAYRDLSGRVSLVISQDIVIRAEQPIEAGRELSFDLTLGATEGAGPAVTATIDAAKATSEAHGMTQRLGTRHLTGKSVALAIVDGGRRVAPDAQSAPAVIDVGPMVEGAFAVGDALADILPVLPERPVVRGDTWSTETPVRSLEGWAWPQGSLATRHRVAAVERGETSTVVTVESEAQARLASLEGQRTYRGELVRKTRWSFDATAGRLLSLTLEQDTDGVSELMDGESPIHQHTRIELKPIAAP